MTEYIPSAAEIEGCRRRREKLIARNAARRRLTDEMVADVAHIHRRSVHSWVRLTRAILAVHGIKASWQSWHQAVGKMTSPPPDKLSPWGQKVLDYLAAQ